MKKKVITIEDLAGMIKRGFDENVKDHQHIFKRLENLENGQEEIMLKLDRVAYRFEIEELDHRLKRIEVKLGLK